MKKIFESSEELGKKLLESIELIQNDKKKDLKLSALSHLINVDRPYDDYLYDDKLLVNLYSKKIDFILKANTKKEIENILSVSHIKFNGDKVMPTEYNIIEEELLMWSMTSLKAHLNDIGQRRYMEVFKKYYGEDLYNEIIQK